MKGIIKLHRKWGNEDIPSITFKELAIYLGVEIRPDGNIKLPQKKWISYLSNLEKAHLNPIQKIEAIRQVVASKIKYQPKLSDDGLEEARKINRPMRKSAKRTLHLPSWTSAWIHYHNGGNILDFLTTIMVSQYNATTKMKVSGDPVAQYDGDRLTPANEERMGRLNLLSVNNKKDEIMKRLEEPLNRLNNGRSPVTALQSTHKTSWLWDRHGLTPRNELCLIQTLSETLLTKINKTRGLLDRSLKICKRWKMLQIEDDASVLATCTFNKVLKCHAQASAP